MNFQHLKENFAGKRGLGAEFRRGLVIPLRACLGVELGPAGLVCTRADRDARGRIRYESLPPAAAAGIMAAGHLRAAGCLPVSDSLTIWLDAPFPAWSKTRRVLPALLDAQLPFALEDCCYSFVAGRCAADGKMQVLALAARRKNVEAQLAKYRAAGVDPVFLDHAGLALWTQSMRETPAAPGEARVLVHVQAEMLTVVTGCAGSFQQAHTLALAPSAPAAAAGAQIDALMSRLERVLFAEAGADWQPHWLLYAGAGAPGPVADELERRLPERWPGRMSRPPDAAGFLSRALAARALTPGHWRCNLREGALLHPAVRGWRRQAGRRAASLVLAAGILLLAGNILWQVAAARRLQTMRQAVAGLAAQLAPAERISYGREVTEVQRAWEMEQQATAGLHAALSADLHARIAQLMAAGAAAEIAFQTLEADDKNFSIRGAAVDWGRFEVLGGRLRAIGFNALLEAMPALEDGRAACVIKGNWR